MLYSLDRPSARVIGGDEDDDTIELQLNESAIQALNEAAGLALAAFEERAADDPHLTTVAANPHATWGLEPKTPAGESGAATLEQEAPAAKCGSEVFEPEPPAPTRAGATVERETPDLRPDPRQRAESVARAPRKSGQFALGLVMVAAAVGLLGGLAYFATARAPHPIPIVAGSGSRQTAAPEAPRSVPAAVQVSAPPAAPDSPIRFRNPFDASEVFEFPAGTSWTEMRDAVAAVLSQRARERQSVFMKRPTRNTKTADPSASVTASRVTPHG